LAGGGEDSLMRDELIDPYQEVWGERLELHYVDGMGHGTGTVAERDRFLDLSAEFLLRTA
jgi:hypothetical protein